MKKTLLLALLLCSSAQAATYVPPEQAFEMYLTRASSGALVLHADVQPGFALYRDKLVVRGRGVKASAMSLPKGIRHDDPALGTTTLLQGSFDVPLKVEAGPTGDMGTLEVHYMGCQLDAYCYPPQKLQFDLAR